jgi:curved DNA-binding protein CbpA
MKMLEEQDHYEVLELPLGARLADIERAYPLVRAAYDENSLALYSVYDELSSAAIRKRIDEAYDVLSNPELRCAYDESVGLDPNLRKPPAEADGLACDDETADAGAAGARHEAGTLEAIDEIEDESGDDYSGARLRRSRLRSGLELDDVSKTTKINPAHLESIEQERFAALPPAVYVRGFVSAYARAVGLDAKVMASGYMQRHEAAMAAANEPRARRP